MTVSELVAQHEAAIAEIAKVGTGVGSDADADATDAWTLKPIQRRLMAAKPETVDDVGALLDLVLVELRRNYPDGGYYDRFIAKLVENAKSGLRG